MNLYIPLNDLNIFLQNLKDFTKYDDYMLDGERLGKQKIVFNNIKEENQFFKDIFQHLPSNSMLVFSESMVESKYLLCVGDIDIEELNFLDSIDLMPSIYTKIDDRVRINFWISCSHLDRLYLSDKVKNFHSIKGKINEKPFFIFDTNDVNKVLHFVRQDTNEFIIKNKTIFVKLSLKFFSQKYNELSPLLEKVQIVDKGDF